jgi:hypothetical protein
MGSQKAWYWLAAGVLVLGINSEYHSGKLQWAQRYVGHSMAVAKDYAHCARNYLAQFEMLLAQDFPGVAAARNRVEDAELSPEDPHDVVVREQVQYAVAQAEMARQELLRRRPQIENALKQLGCQHAEIEMAGQVALGSAGSAVMVCPRSQRIRLNIPQVRIPQVRVEVPQVRVEIPRVRIDVPQIHLAPIVDNDDTL